MFACHVWLRTDALIRAGFHLEMVDGRRWAVRDHLVFELEPVCVCGPDVCPPHPITHLSLEEAA